jgi:hypothetical protein
MGHTRPEEAPVATMVLVRGAVMLVVGIYLSCVSGFDSRLKLGRTTDTVGEDVGC